MNTGIIVAMTKERVIGINNQIPWHSKEDLQNFKKVTDNSTVIMGRKTWESLPPKFRPLPNRNNIVVSRTIQSLEGATVCNSIESAIEKAKEFKKECFFIGGARVYAEALKHADTFYISWMKESFEGDTKFPEFNINNWDKVESQDFKEFIFTKYVRKENA